MNNDNNDKHTNHNHVTHNHDDGEDCHSCGSHDCLSQIQSESEDTEEMDDDYDPTTGGNKADSMTKLASKLAS